MSLSWFKLSQELDISPWSCWILKAEVKRGGNIGLKFAWWTHFQINANVALRSLLDV